MKKPDIKKIIKKKIEINNGSKTIISNNNEISLRERKNRGIKKVQNNEVPIRTPQKVEPTVYPRIVSQVQTNKKISEVSQSRPKIMTERDKMRLGYSVKNNGGAYHMNERDRKRLGLYSAPKTHAQNSMHELINNYKKRISQVKSSSVYKRVDDSQYDVVILISSYNRLTKLQRLIGQFYQQETKYRFRVVLLNDGSTEGNYDNLVNVFPELEYHKNKTNNGRNKYWYTVTQLWKIAEKYKTDTIMMIDDDFILAEGYLNAILDLFYNIKQKNNDIVAIAPHLHSYNENTEYQPWWYNTFSIDGIGLFDISFIKEMNYQLQPVTEEMLAKILHAHGWSQIQKRIVETNKIAYKTRHSIAWHDGNDESKLGKHNPNKSKAYTHKFIGKAITLNDLLF